MNLAPVRSDHADVLGRHPVLPHAGDLLDVLKHGDSFLDVEEARARLFLQVLPDDPPEYERSLALGRLRETGELEAAVDNNWVSARLQFGVVEELGRHLQQGGVRPKVANQLGDAPRVIRAIVSCIERHVLHQPLQQ